jgi:alpha-1,6-mannosyltransferase
MRIVALSGVILSVCVFCWVRGDATHHIATHLASFGAAFAAYLLALLKAPSLTKRGFGLALAASLVWRAALVLAPPLLSDDVARYVWEGRIQRHGGNPYLFSDRPESSRWAFLRDEVWQGVNHKDYAAIYPPFWQLAARAVVTVHDSVLAMKLFLLVCEILALLLLARFLRERALPEGRLLIWAWSPLALVEIAGSGHNEPLGLLCLVAALATLEARPLVSALFVGLGIETKLLPGLMALAWARRYRPWHALAASGVALALLIPFAAAGADLFRTLSKYGQLWRFNETLFDVFALLGPWAAVRISLLSVALFAAFLAWRGMDPARAGLWVVSAWLVCAPSVLPWYGLWLLPFLVLMEAPAALLFTGTVSLAYLVYPQYESGGPWQVSGGIRLLEYGPCAVVALLSLAPWQKHPLSRLPRCPTTLSSSS